MISFLLIRAGELQTSSPTMSLRHGDSGWSARATLPPGYSHRRATTGSMREAFSAGHVPAVTPTKARITKAISITLLEVFKMMSPS